MDDIRSQMVGAASGVYSTLSQVASALGVVAAIWVLVAAVFASSASYTLAFAISLLIIGACSASHILLNVVFPKYGSAPGSLDSW